MCKKKSQQAIKVKWPLPGNLKKGSLLLHFSIYTDLCWQGFQLRVMTQFCFTYVHFLKLLLFPSQKEAHLRLVSCCCHIAKNRSERESEGSAYYVLGALVKCLGALVKCLAGWGEVFWGSERWEKKGFWISLLNGNILQIHMPQLFTVQLNIYSPRTTFTWLSKKLNCKELTCMHLGWVNHYNIKKLQSWIFIHYSAVVAFVLSAKCCLVSLIFCFVLEGGRIWEV